MKKTFVTDVYIRIWSSRLSFTALQWMKTNFNICQFSTFLLRSVYAIKVKIRKLLKLLDSVPFIKKNVQNMFHSNLILLTDFHSFTGNEEKLQN